jgi:deoxyadenosine/deoxycytidine kinase
MKSNNGLLVIFEGPPASGKTMLANKFAKEYTANLILEPVRGTILPRFYNEIKTRAFLTQMYLLSKRIQNQTNVINLLRAGNIVIQDYTFIKDYVYAQIFLNKEEFNIYKKYYRLFKKLDPIPNILFLLDCNTDTIMKRIINRKRKGELKLSKQDFNHIRSKTIKLLKKTKFNKIIRIDTSDYQIDLHKKDRDDLFKLILDKYSSLC